MSRKSEARREARKLKEFGIPFLLRVKIAKKLVRGKYSIDILEDMGFQVTRSYGCSCCSPMVFQTFTLGEDNITTDSGKIDGYFKKE